MTSFSKMSKDQTSERERITHKFVKYLFNLKMNQNLQDCLKIAKLVAKEIGKIPSVAKVALIGSVAKTLRNPANKIRWYKERAQ